MRATTRLALTLIGIGLGMFGLAFLALFKLIAQVSGGGYGPQPVTTFIAEHFWALGLWSIVAGVVTWLMGLGLAKKPATPVPAEPEAVGDRSDDPDAR
ncbi:hypothetical protein [Pseudomonas sp. CGJS7]|uniref:hypothetical protein n=1 Tax=Pseudomonas sp. CGJS7 TaxID=3109348 RepID=UPI00300850B0